MNCATVRETFAELIDGGLPAGREAEIRSHLDACPACRREWREYRATVNALQGLGQESPSAGFSARVRGRIEAPPWWRRAARWLVFPLSVKLPLHAAALVVLGVAGVWLFEQSPEMKRSATLRLETVAPTAPSSAELPQEAESKGAPPAPTAPVAPAMKASLPPAPSILPSVPSAAPPQPVPPVPDQQRAAPDAAAQSQIGADASVKSEGTARLESAAKEGASQRQAGSVAAPAPAASPPTVAGQPSPFGASRSRSTLQATAPAADAAADLFMTGKDAWAARDFGRAAASLREFLTRTPQDPRAPEARFLLAEAYRADGRFADAVGAYTEFLRQSPNDERTTAAMFGLAESRVSLGDRSGCDLLREMLTRYPNVPEAALAGTFLSSHCP